MDADLAAFLAWLESQAYRDRLAEIAAMPIADGMGPVGA